MLSLHGGFLAKVSAQTSVNTTPSLSILRHLQCSFATYPTKLFLVAEVKMKKPSGSSQFKVDKSN